MSTPDKAVLSAVSEELWQLVAAYCDGLLAEPERDRLEDLLAGDAAARQFFNAYLDLHATLLWRFREAGRPAPDAAEPVSVEPEIAAPTSEAPAPLSTAVAAAPTGLRLFGGVVPYELVVGVVLACTLLPIAYVATLTWGMFDKKGGRRGVESGEWAAESGQQAASDRRVVARITASEDAEWQTSDPGAPNAPIQHSAFSLQHSQIPRSAPLNLASGTIALKLNKGVKLLVEGPAQWTIDGDNRATLTRGKLIATVPQQAIGFTIKTPTSEIVDLGTEFGVEVDERGQTQTNVFRGEIRVEQPAATAAPAKRSITLTAGQAVSIDRSGKATFIEPLASTPAEFIRPPAAIARDEFNPDVLSPYARYVIEQTKPVAYWDFSWYRDSMKIVNDRIAARPFEQFLPRHVGMMGPSARQGFPGFGEQNPAVSQDAGTAVAQGLVYRSMTIPTAGYTMALWIQPSGDFERQPHYYVLGNGHAARGPNEGVRDSLLIVGNRNPPQTGRPGFFDGRDASSLPIPTGGTTLVPGKWYWVVLVREPEKASVYLNGKVELAVDSRWSDKPGELFSFGHRVDLFPTIPFQGQLDEATLWDRALGAEEIAAIYHQATGQPAREPGAVESGR